MTKRNEIGEGSILVVTEDFDNLVKGEERVVKKDEHGLYIETADFPRRLEVGAGKTFYGLELKEE